MCGMRTCLHAFENFKCNMLNDCYVYSDSWRMGNECGTYSMVFTCVSVEKFYCVRTEENFWHNKHFYMIYFSLDLAHLAHLVLHDFHLQASFNVFEFYAYFCTINLFSFFSCLPVYWWGDWTCLWRVLRGCTHWIFEIWGACKFQGSHFSLKINFFCIFLFFNYLALPYCFGYGLQCSWRGCQTSTMSISRL